jgi:FAD/FMN-containing dehydrogenase
MTAMSLSETVLSRIAAILGEGGLLRGDAVAALDPGYHPANLGAGVVAAPGSAAVLSDLLALCNAERIPVIAQGGLTGLAGGAVSEPGALAVSTRRLTDLLHIDPIGRVAVADAGVTLDALQRAAADHGLSPGIDLAARGSATLGGMAATNAGGIEAFRNGTMRDRLLGCRFVRADGALVDDLARVPKNNTGYGLTDLLVGSEGTLGIITRVAIRLERARPVAATALLGLAGLPEALKTAGLLRDDIGAPLRAAEVMWRDYVDAVAAAHGLAADTAALGPCPLALLVEVEEAPEGGSEGRFLECLARYAETGLVATVAVARNRRQREALWTIREDADAIYRLWPAVASFDISVPLDALDDYCRSVEAGLKRLAAPLGVYMFGHLADGNLHILVGWRSGEAVPPAALEDVLYPPLIEIGGAFSAEHGIGRDRRRAFGRFVPPERRRMMAEIKAALDPNGILNPGTIFAPPVRG